MPQLILICNNNNYTPCRPAVNKEVVLELCVHLIMNAFEVIPVLSSLLILQMKTPPAKKF